MQYVAQPSATGTYDHIMSNTTQYYPRLLLVSGHLNVEARANCGNVPLNPVTATLPLAMIRSTRRLMEMWNGACFPSQRQWPCKRR